jgi:hypothetical protein
MMLATIKKWMAERLSGLGKPVYRDFAESNTPQDRHRSLSIDISGRYSDTCTTFTRVRSCCTSCTRCAQRRFRSLSQ